MKPGLLMQSLTRKSPSHSSLSWAACLVIWPWYQLWFDNLKAAINAGLSFGTTYSKGISRRTSFPFQFPSTEGVLKDVVERIFSTTLMITSWVDRHCLTSYCCHLSCFLNVYIWWNIIYTWSLPLFNDLVVKTSWSVEKFCLILNGTKV